MLTPMASFRAETALTLVVASVFAVGVLLGAIDAVVNVVRWLAW
jgi:hypothetical protein